MSEGKEPKKKSSDESIAGCSSTMQTTKIAAGLDHTKLSPMIRHLVENMSDEHWRIVRNALCVPRTKVEVGHLCEGIVVRVVRTARFYLLPALREVQGVPTAHVLTCGPKRVNTSEAKETAKPFPGQGTQEVTNEMLLAAAKKEVDKIVLQSVIIFSGSESAVPVFVEEPRRVDPANTIPMLNHLTNAQFQQRAANQMSGCLLRKLESESGPASPTGKSSNGENKQLDTEVESLTDLGHLNDFYPPGPRSESVAENLVGEVIDLMNESVSDQDVHSAAFSMVGHVIEEVKGAVQSALTIGAISLKRVYAASERLLSVMKNTMRNLCISSSSQKAPTMADARSLIAQVIKSMQHELPEPKSPEDLEQGLLMHGILGALLKEVQMAKRPQSPRLPGDSQRDVNTKVCGTLIRPEVTTERIPLPLKYPTVILSPVSANDTMARVVDTIFEWEKCVPTTRGHEQVITDPNIEQHYHGIACEIKKILQSHPDLQTVYVPVGKSLSDSVLIRLRPRAGEKNKLPSGLVYNYIEEAVKRLLLSSLFPSASNHQPAQGHLKASKAFSDELRSAVEEFTNVISQEVILKLSTQLEENMASHDEVGLVRENQKLSNLADSLHSPLSLLESRNSYASLVSMLVIQLLKKINGIHQHIDQGGLPDNVLDMSRALIERILLELEKSFGIASEEHYPEDLKCHLIFQRVYKELVQHFGSENALGFALESEAPSFATSLANKLTREIVATCNLASSPESTVQPAVEPQENKDKMRKKMFFFRLKMPTLNWKRSGASKGRATETSSKSSKTVPQVKEALGTAQPLEEPQEEPTAGCYCFRIPKLTFSFKKMMKCSKVGPCDYMSSSKESRDVPASSSETQLDEATAERPPSEDSAEQETGSGHSDMSTREYSAV